MIMNSREMESSTAGDIPNDAQELGRGSIRVRAREAMTDGSGFGTPCWVRTKSCMAGEKPRDGLGSQE